MPLFLGQYSRSSTNSNIKNVPNFPLKRRILFLEFPDFNNKEARTERQMHLPIG
jgi:hypothetical protein